MMRFIFIQWAIWFFAVAPALAREELTFWNALSGGQPKAAIERFVDEFNATHAGLGEVRKLDIPYVRLDEKLLTAVAGNVSPGLVLFNRPNSPGFTIRGAFEPWDPYFAELGIHPDDFFKNCWGDGLHEGKQYCLPFNTDVRVLYYNRELFRQSGLDPDRPPRDWKELREMSRKLTKYNPNGSLAQAGFVPIGGYFGNTFFQLFAFQMGDDMRDAEGRIKVNGPRSIKAMEWVLDFVREYDAKKLMMLQTASGVDELSLFLQERVAMIGDEGYMLSLIRRYKPKLDFAVAPLPWPEEGRPATWSGGYGFVLPRGKKLTPLGKAFVEFMLSREKQLEYGKLADQIPALKSAAQDPYFTHDPHWRVFIDQMQYVHALPPSPLIAKAFNELIRTTEQVIYEKKTPAQALNDTQKILDDELKTLTAYDSNPKVSWGSMVLWATVILTLFAGIRMALAIRKIRRLTLKRSEAWWGYIMASPAIAGLLGLALGPMIISLMLSGCKYDILTPARWLGGANYAKLLTGDPSFYTSLWNTVYYTLFSVPIGVVVSLGLAVLLNRKVWFRAFWRTMFYMPSLFPVVAGSFLWLWLFNGEYGLLNSLLHLAGIGPIPWLTDAHWAKPALVVMSLWGVGTNMIIFLAALQSVPETMYEAGMIDGARPWQRFRHITLPMISPSIFFVFIIGTIGSFQVFTQAFLMTEGGPLDSTLFYVLYLFRQGFQFFHMGYAAAMAWILCVIVMGLTAAQFGLGKRMVHYGG